jgi:hypothetical protein
MLSLRIMLLALIDTAFGMIFKFMLWDQMLTQTFAPKMQELENLEITKLILLADMDSEFSIIWFQESSHAEEFQHQILL